MQTEETSGENFMVEKTYFYRKLYGSDFVKSDSEKTIIPVRLKNQFISDSIFFDSEKNVWQKTSSLPEESDSIQPAEFVEFPLKPAAPKFSGFSRDGIIDIEDLSPAEMTDYYLWKEEERRFFINTKYYKDDNGIIKDFFAAEIASDDENLILYLSFTKFDHPEITNENARPTPPAGSLPFSKYSNELPKAPVTSKVSFIFDMKKGSFTSSIMDKLFDDNLNLELSRRRFNRKQEELCKRYKQLLNCLKVLELNTYPKEVLCEAYKKLCHLAQKYTGLKKTPTASDPLARFEKNEEARFLSEMYILTMLPCEPKLYGILMKDETQELKINFKYKRNDTKVLNKFLRKAHIKGYRILRKEYEENPDTLLTYRRLKDAGFRDINLYNKVIQNEAYQSEILHCPREALIFFSRYSIKKRDQIATLNTLLKGADLEDADYFDNLDKWDAMSMFMNYFSHIPERLRKDILKDGFTVFNHNALSNISYQVKNKNITFSYSQDQKDLEDDIDGYSFRLPENSYKLCDIGTVLHNCVASYADQVSEKKCTIVYATKEDHYQICIEVDGNEVMQERVDHNRQPDSKEKLILQKWHDRHDLKIGY